MCNNSLISLYGFIKKQGNCPWIIFCLLLFQNALEENKLAIQSLIEEIEENCSKLKSVMGDLKTQLYAKFGNHINLEADEE